MSCKVPGLLSLLCGLCLGNHDFEQVERFTTQKHKQHDDSQSIVPSRMLYQRFSPNETVATTTLPLSAGDKKNRTPERSADPSPIQ